MIPRAGRDGKRRIDHVCPHGLKADSVDGLFHFTHHAGSRLLEHDVIRWNRHHALALCLSMIFFGKPVSTFPDHALIHKFHIGSITVVHRGASCAMHRPAKVGFTRKSGV